MTDGPFYLSSPQSRGVAEIVSCGYPFSRSFATFECRIDAAILAGKSRVRLDGIAADAAKVLLNGDELGVAFGPSWQVDLPAASVAALSVLRVELVPSTYKLLWSSSSRRRGSARCFPRSVQRKEKLCRSSRGSRSDAREGLAFQTGSAAIPTDFSLNSMNQIIINAVDGSTRISRHIYGHSAEHLGTVRLPGCSVSYSIKSSNRPNEETMTSAKQPDAQYLVWQLF